jgi:hypothetical protein
MIIAGSGSSLDLERVDSRHPILELAGSVNWNYADRNLYGVELNPKVFDWERRFFEANLHWIPGKRCDGHRVRPSILDNLVLRRLGQLLDSIRPEASCGGRFGTPIWGLTSGRLSLYSSKAR